jgi:glycosyltransferase involved in cell wall biosynthesis
MAPAHLPSRLLGAALWRGVTEQVDRITAEPTDLVYAGTSSALVVAPLAARRLSIPFAVDLEDFHSAEQTDSPDARLDHRSVAVIESRFLRGAAFLTAGSQGIAQAYAASYQVAPIPIHNVFPLPDREPPSRPVPPPPRKLYWFSQTIGLDRGLQDVVRALGLSTREAHLYLQGNAAPGVEVYLRRLAADVAPFLKMDILPPVNPDHILPSLTRFDVGLAVEQPVSLNRSICLTNKALTYILAGMPVVMTDTVGQRQLAKSLGKGALLYPPGDFVALATNLEPWLSDDNTLKRAGEAAWQAARDRWHWEHPLERGALLGAVHTALGDC